MADHLTVAADLMPLVTNADSDWTAKLEGLPPGDHIAVLTGTSTTGIVGRLAGLELRDVLTVLLPGPETGFVFLFRIPFREPTVAAQVLSTGTGGLNIAGCRVGLSGGTKRSGQAQHLLKDDGTEDRSQHWARTGHTVVEIAGGRWPPNVVFVHTAQCRNVGTKQVKNLGGSSSGESAFGQNSGWNKHNNRTTTITRNRDEDGFETVADWTCGPGCPVPALDSLSGDRPSTLSGRADPTVGHEHPADVETDSWFSGGLSKGSRVYADAGGASRYYPQFEDLDSLLDWLSELVGCHPSG